MFHVKICGLTRVDDALAAAQAGADAIGLNFYSGSPRCVAPGAAAQIAAAVPGLLRVGVFVGADVATIARLVREVPLDAVQVHGDWTSQGAPRQAIAGSPTIVAFRVVPGRLAELDTWTVAAPADAMMLVDAYRPGSFGGTGHTAPWHELVGWRQRWPGRQLALAGGLTADNVAAAIAQVRPTAVDVASGVESAPGVKDHGRMAAFIERACAALAAGG